MLLRFVDKTLVCQDCREEFTWTVSEQEYYAVEGYADDPRRCPACRRRRRQESARAFSQHPAVCADCGKSTTVPFVPHKNRPVYCRECYEARKGSSPSLGTSVSSVMG